MINELEKVAKYLGGEVVIDNDGTHSVMVRTDDRSSKENYDDMLEFMGEIGYFLHEYEVDELWADHDTQIIYFKKVEPNDDPRYPVGGCSCMTKTPDPFFHKHDCPVWMYDKILRLEDSLNKEMKEVVRLQNIILEKIDG